MERNRQEFFDQACLETIHSEIERELKSESCLKEREEFWQFIYGFIVAHLEWLEKIRAG